MRLEEHFEVYAKHLLTSHISPEGLKGSLRRLRDFGKYFSNLGYADLEEVSREVIEGYLEEVRKKKKRFGKDTGKEIRETTKVMYFSELKRFLKHLERSGEMRRHVSVFIEWKKVPKRLPKKTPAEKKVREMIEAVDEKKRPRDRTILELLYGTGLRVREAASLEIEDIDFEEKRIVVRNGKGKRERILPLAPRLERVLWEYLVGHRKKWVTAETEERKLFLSRETRRSLTRFGLMKVVKNYLTDAGIAGGAHTLRHSFATHLLKNGASVLYIQRLLGHRRLSTTTIYTRVYPAQLREMIFEKHPGSFYPAVTPALPIRYRRIKPGYLLKLRAMGKAVPDKVYTYEKLALRLPEV